MTDGDRINFSFLLYDQTYSNQSGEKQSFVRYEITALTTLELSNYGDNE